MYSICIHGFICDFFNSMVVCQIKYIYLTDIS